MRYLETAKLNASIFDAPTDARNTPADIPR